MAGMNIDSDSGDGLIDGFLVLPDWSILVMEKRRWVARDEQISSQKKATWHHFVSMWRILIGPHGFA